MRASLSQIVLAQEPDFNLGGLIVRPSKLQVVYPTGRALLQPRIMQVFVALARRRGEVVSRDEMMALCWGGFAVSDDAINRCIARIRRLSQDHGGFILETIPRVGYQLNEAKAAEIIPEPVEEPVVPQPAPVLQAPAPSWLARNGAVAAISFASGVVTTAAAFAMGHLL